MSKIVISHKRLDWWASDEAIENTYSDFHIESFNREERSVEISFGDRETIVDHYIIYDDGRIAFDHWFPEFLYFELCRLIRGGTNV